MTERASSILSSLIRATTLHRIASSSVGAIDKTETKNHGFNLPNQIRNLEEEGGGI